MSRAGLKAKNKQSFQHAYGWLKTKITKHADDEMRELVRILNREIPNIVSKSLAQMYPVLAQYVRTANNAKDPGFLSGPRSFYQEKRMFLPYANLSDGWLVQKHGWKSVMGSKPRGGKRKYGPKHKENNFFHGLNAAAKGQQGSKYQYDTSVLAALDKAADIPGMELYNMLGPLRIRTADDTFGKGGPFKNTNVIRYVREGEELPGAGPAKESGFYREHRRIVKRGGQRTPQAARERKRIYSTRINEHISGEGLHFVPAGGESKARSGTKVSKDYLYKRIKVNGKTRWKGFSAVADITRMLHAQGIDYEVYKTKSGKLSRKFHSNKAKYTLVHPGDAIKASALRAARPVGYKIARRAGRAYAYILKSPKAGQAKRLELAEVVLQRLMDDRFELSLFGNAFNMAKLGADGNFSGRNIMLRLHEQSGSDPFNNGAGAKLGGLATADFGNNKIRSQAGHRRSKIQRDLIDPMMWFMIRPPQDDEDAGGFVYRGVYHHIRSLTEPSSKRYK